MPFSKKGLILPVNEAFLLYHGNARGKRTMQNETVEIGGIMYSAFEKTLLVLDKDGNVIGKVHRGEVDSVGIFHDSNGQIAGISFLMCDGVTGEAVQDGE